MWEIAAGAVVYTLTDGEIRYLVIRDFHDNFGFPKGHLEEGEDERQAALREIKEETGVDVELDDSFHEVLEYVMPNGIGKRVHYFIASFAGQKPVRQEEEVRELCLLSYDEAMAALTFDNMKEVLIHADQYLRKDHE